MTQTSSNTHKPPLQAWLLAMRPKTLTASLVPVVAATALADAAGAQLSWLIALCSFFAAFCIQVGTNLINDALDFKKGADTETRIGPARVTQMGWLSARQVMTGGLLFLLAALIIGIPLMMQGGPLLVGVLIVSAICGYLYTGGPYPLAYVGLGDLFVLIFFGLVLTAAVFFLQTGYVDVMAVLAGLQIGLLATVMIAVNNLRDLREDAKVNKLTMAARFGKTFSRWEITCLVLLPFILNLGWVVSGFGLAALLSCFSLPIGLQLLRGIWNNEPGRIYNKFLAIAALLHLTFGLLLSLGLLL